VVLAYTATEPAAKTLARRVNYRVLFCGNDFMSTGNILLTNAITGASSSELQVSRAETH